MSKLDHRRTADRALALLSWGLLASMLAAALHDMSQAWDVWSYHLPFAARIAGVVPADRFAFNEADQARFAGFPILMETLQGALWRVTGRAESANLVAFSAVPLFAWFLRRRFDVPFHLSVLALLAVPLVQIHATSCYVDLPANAAASVVVLLAAGAWARPAPPTRRTLALAGLAAAIAINSKALMHPIVLLALVAIAARALPALVRDVRAGGEPRRAGGSTLIAVALAVPVIFATPAKNAIVHHNPYYPEVVSVFGARLPGVEEPYASSPRWLENAPRPVRFAASIAEIGLRPMTSTRRWTVDQWTPPADDGYRMGGFFGAYVIANLALLAWRTVRQRRDRTVRAAAATFAALTAVVSVMPQSHELRYYMCWMIVLVATNLWLATRAPAPAPELGAQTLVAALALAAVVVVTRAGYVYPSGEGFRDVVQAHADDGALRDVRDGEHVCVHHAPWNLLYAAPFHAPRDYAVKEADDLASCGADRPL